MTELSPELIREISEVHLIKTELVPSDLLFVFGTRDGFDEFLAKILDLWNAGYFKYCIVSGGVTEGGIESECATLKREMIRQGIPSNIILEEHKAMNTGENVVYSLRVIDRAIGLKNVQSVIALGKICTSRRYLMTLQRYWPNVEKMLVPVNYFTVDRDYWYLDEDFRERVLREYKKIAPYKKRGFITEWP